MDEKLRNARILASKVKELANSMNLEFFFVTEGASSCSIRENEAVRNARKEHEKWETEHGFDPLEDWSNEKYEE